jgi:putative ABC transport system permease protein
MTVRRALRIFQLRARSLSQKRDLDMELSDEMAFHFDQLVEENIADGMSPGEAEVAARRVLGNVALLEEQCRDHRRVGWLHDLWQDVRYGMRMLRKSPGFTAIVATSLALGIGSNTAILAVSKQVLLGDLPVTDDSRLVLIRSTVPQAPIANNNATVPEFVGWKERSRSFESMGAALGYTEDFGLGENGAPPERVSGYLVTADLFPTLRVQPLMGRVFTEQETELENPAPVVILSYGLWQRRFGADANILGKSIRVGGSARTVIGVMPQGFWFPFDGSQYWGPLAFNRAQLKGSARFFVVTARLKDGVTLKQAQAEMDSIGANYAQEEPGPDQNRAIRLDVLREAWWGWARQPLATFEVAVALVLLIACANVATLLLARGAARAPEIAMRSRWVRVGDEFCDSC